MKTYGVTALWTLTFLLVGVGCRGAVQDLWMTCAPCKAADFVPKVSLARDCGNSVGSEDVGNRWRACVEGALDAGISFRAAASLPGIDSRIDEVFGRLPDGPFFYLQEDSSISGGAPFFSCEGAVFSSECERLQVHTGWNKTPYAECLPEHTANRVCFEQEQKRPSPLRIGVSMCIAALAGVWLWRTHRASRAAVSQYRPNARWLVAWATMSMAASAMGPSVLRAYFALGHRGADLEGEAWLLPMTFCMIWAGCVTAGQVVMLRRLGHVSWLWIPVSSLAWTLFGASSTFFDTALMSTVLPALPGLLQSSFFKSNLRRAAWWTLSSGFGAWCWAWLAGRVANFNAPWWEFCTALALAGLPYAVVTGAALVLTGGSNQPVDTRSA